MTMDTGTFATLSPSQFISFTFPNPFIIQPTLNHFGDFLRVAVLDSHLQTTNPPQIAAMLVPKNREDDWIFSTENGQLQLLSNLPGISRLILVGIPPQGDKCSPMIYNRPIQDDLISHTKFKESLTPLLLALSPKSAFLIGLPEIPFVTYEDDVVRSILVERCIGSCVGEMLVENVELEINGHGHSERKREFRRRLRFKRMPNLVQTEILIVPEQVANSENNSVDIGLVKFHPDMGCLVHPYLPPMVASLALIAPYLEEQLGSNSRPRVLCVGVGGGALLSFLQTYFGFEVFGVDNDEMVIRVAKQYFGLVEGEFLRVCVGDGIELLENIARGVQRNMVSDSNSDVGIDQNAGVFHGFGSPVDVIMVDLDASDARNGLGAPPFEFIRNSVLLSVKFALRKFGILVVNVIPLSRFFYDCLIREFREIFSELYEINVGNDENYVLIATVSPLNFATAQKENSILKKLKLSIPEEYMDRIVKI